MHVFGWWEEAKVLGRNRHEQVENMRQGYRCTITLKKCMYNINYMSLYSSLLFTSLQECSLSLRPPLGAICKWPHCVYGIIKVRPPSIFECYYTWHYINPFVFPSSNSIIAGLSVTTWQTEWTSHHSLTCSNIHHRSFLSKNISFKQTCTPTHHHHNP